MVRQTNEKPRGEKTENSLYCLVVRLELTLDAIECALQARTDEWWFERACQGHV